MRRLKNQFWKNSGLESQIGRHFEIRKFSDFWVEIRVPFWICHSILFDKAESTIKQTFAICLTKNPISARLKSSRIFQPS